MPKNKLIIGPSNGWLYAAGIFDLAKHEQILKLAGANAVESGGLSRPERINSLLSDKPLLDFDYRTHHLPDYNPKKSIPEQIDLASKVIKRHKVQQALIHPLKVDGRYPENYYAAIRQAGLKLAIENMDSQKDSGFSIEELEKLIQENQAPLDLDDMEWPLFTNLFTKDLYLDFVFDTQHAYEHDSSMKDYVQRLWDMALSTERLVHLHVSGETRQNGKQSNNHSLVYESTNQEAIASFLQRNYSSCPIPIILEGQSIGRTPKQEDLEAAQKLPLEERTAEATKRLKSEIDFLRQVLD